MAFAGPGLIQGTCRVYYAGAAIGSAVIHLQTRLSLWQAGPVKMVYICNAEKKQSQAHLVLGSLQARGAHAPSLRRAILKFTITDKHYA